VRIVRKLAAIGAVLAAAILLFVVVCPVTPTPTAVVTARNTPPVSAVILALAVVLPLLTLVSTALFQHQCFTDARETLAPLTVRHRTCIHLC
jgi:hypothetical protein